MKIASTGVTREARAVERWLSFAGKALFFFGLVVLAFESAEASAASVVAFFMGPILIGLSYAWMAFPREHGASIEVVGDELVVTTSSSRTTTKLTSMRSAHVVGRELHGTRQPAVHVRTRAGNVIEMMMPDEQSGVALVDALGFGPRGRAVTIDLAKRSRRPLNILLGIVAIFAGFMGAICAAAIVSVVLHRPQMFGDRILVGCFSLTAFAYAFLKRLLAPPVIAIGVDGVAVKKLLGTVRVARGNIVGAALGRADGPLLVERRDGAALVVDHAGVDPAAMMAAAAECKRRFGAHEELPRAPTFERGGRDVGAWRAGLRVALDAGYREAGVSADDARGVLTSTSASTEQRIGAALALRVAGEPPEKIRVAADTVVDPRVRVAFEAIADDADDAELERVLKRLG